MLTGVIIASASSEIFNISKILLIIKLGNNRQHFTTSDADQLLGEIQVTSF